MESSSTAEVYSRAGFGHSIERGSQPAVVVVDFSYGFTESRYPTGADMSASVLATRRLLESARSKGVPVIFTAIAYDNGQIETLAWLKKATGMAALKQGSRLVEIDDRLDPRPREHLLIKTGASAFFGTALASYLASAHVDTLIVVGATTSGCVRATVVDAVQHGYPTLVPRDCVADRAQAPHEASLFDINEKYGDVVDLDEVLDYIDSLPTADAPPQSDRPGTPASDSESTIPVPAEARA